MNALPLVNSSYAASGQSVLPQRATNAVNKTSAVSSEANDSSSQTGGNHFLETLRSHFNEHQGDAQPLVKAFGSPGQLLPNRAAPPAAPKQALSAQTTAKIATNSVSQYLNGNLSFGTRALQTGPQTPAPSLDSEQTQAPSQPTGNVPAPKQQTIEPAATEPAAGPAPNAARLAEAGVAANNAQPAVPPSPDLNGAVKQQAGKAQPQAAPPASANTHKADSQDAQEQLEVKPDDKQDAVSQSLEAAAALICDLAPNVVPSTGSDAPRTESHSSSNKSTPDAASPIEAPNNTLLTAAPTSGNLALALRVNSNSTDQDAQPDPRTPISGQSQNPLTSGQAAVSVAPVRPEQKSEPMLEGLAPLNTPVDHNPGSAPVTHTPDAAPVHGSDFEAELAKFRAADPVRGAHVQIAGTDDQRVDIRLVERAGTLSVTVRSSDNTLARTLQDHANDLSARLSTEHYRTEMWTPSTGGTSASRDFSDNSQQQNRGSAFQGGGNPNQQQNQKQQQQQPEWVDELEKNSNVFQKRIEYTWQ